MNNDTKTIDIFRVLAAVILGAMLLLAMLALPLNQVILNPLTYTSMLERSGAYETSPLELVGLSKTGDYTASTGLLDNLTGEEYGESFQDFIPNTWLGEQVNRIILQVFTQMALGTQEPMLDVDLTGIKQPLLENKDTITGGILARMPSCSELELQPIMEKILSGDFSALPFCRLPEPFRFGADAFISAAVNGLISSLPDTLVLAGTGAEALWQLNPEQISTWDKMGDAYRTGRTIFPLAALCALAAGAALIFLAVRRPRKLALMSGVTFAVTGVLLLGVSLGLLLLGTILPEAVLQAINFSLPVRIETVLEKTLRLVLNRYILWTSLEGLVGFGVGAVLTLLGGRLR